MILELGDALRASSLRLARIGRVQSVIEESPGTRDILARYIAGDTTQSALGAARDLMETGRAVTVSYLGPDADSRAIAADAANPTSRRPTRRAPDSPCSPVASRTGSRIR